MKTLILTIILATCLSITTLSAKNPKHTVYCNIETTEIGYIKEYTTVDDKTAQIANKISFHYNATGNVLKRTFYKWDNSAGWKAIQKYEYAYNDKKQVTCVTHTKWDKKLQNWSVDSERLNLVYDNEDKLIAVKSLIE